MPAPVPLPLRRALWQRFQRGQDAATIAAALGLAPRTVRHLLRRWQDQGAASLGPTYEPLGRSEPPARAAYRAVVLDLRRQHACWGAGLLRIMLQRLYPQADLPGERTLQRWLHQAGLGPAPPGRRPARAAVGRAAGPHDVWQVDAAERMRLRSAQQVSWLRLVDECSGAVLQTTVFPPRELAPGRGHGRARGLAQRLYSLGSAPHRACR